MAITDVNLENAPKYYEADGAIRAANNRMTLLAGAALFAAIACACVALAARLQPPTVIRVSPSGEAQVISPRGDLRSTINPNIVGGITNMELPTDLDKQGYINRFLDLYLSYDAPTLPSNWSKALNMSTPNLRHSILTNLHSQDVVSRYQNAQVRSAFTLVKEVADPDGLTYNIFGRREIHSVDNDQETVKNIVEAYKVRLLMVRRDDKHPDGLLIADFTVTQISGDDQNATTGVPTATGNATPATTGGSK